MCIITAHEFQWPVDAGREFKCACLFVYVCVCSVNKQVRFAIYRRDVTGLFIHVPAVLNGHIILLSYSLMAFVRSLYTTRSVL